MKKIGMWSLVSVCLISLTGCSSHGGLAHPTTNSTSVAGPAAVPPQIDGTIKSIKAGDPSYVTLTNVLVDGKQADGPKQLQLPPGHYVSKDHWQSDGDTLDLFLGEGLIELTQTGQITDVTPDKGFAGIVKSVKSTQIVIQKVLYDTQSSDSHAMKATDQTVSIRLAPYTRILSNGLDTAPYTSLHAGDAVLFVLIGPPSEYIATQITDFRSPSAAGWDMQ